MFRRVRAFALVCWLSTGPASADRLVLGVDQSITGKSNTFNTVEPQIADGIYEIRPIIQLLREEEPLHYDVVYSPSYEAYFETSGLNGLDHFLRGDLGYRPGEIGAFNLALDFADYRATRAQTVEGPGGIPDLIPATVGRVRRTLGDAAYAYDLTPATTAITTVEFQRYTYTTPNNIDNYGVGGDISVVTEPRSNFGIGGSIVARHRQFEQKNLTPASQNLVLNANLILRGEPAPTVSFQVETGPAYVRVHRNTVGSSDQDLVTPFVRAFLRKDDSWGNAVLSLRRQEDTAGGTRSTTIRTSVTASVLYRGFQPWSLVLRGNWNERVAEQTPDPGDATSDTTQYWVDLRGRRKLGGRLGFELGFRYIRQSRSLNPGPVFSEFDNFIGSFLLSYELHSFEY